jgi:GT2 family glycosyltransferase
VGFEGSQDYDLVLRFIERVKPQQIRHIPYVLYHWGAVSGSTARSVSEKDYPPAVARRAVQEHLRRMSVTAQVEPAPGAEYHQRLRYALPKPEPLVTIIIPTRAEHELFYRCLTSICEKTSYPAYEIIVVANQTKAPEALARLEHMQTQGVARVLRYDQPFNFPAINNWAASQARGTVLCLLNDDIEVISPDWLTEMTSHAVRREVGAVGAKLYYPDGRLQHAGVILGIGGCAGHAYKRAPGSTTGQMNRAIEAQDFSAVTAACLVVRKEVYEQVGGLDEARFSVAFNDIDFCLRIREAGYRNVWTPYAELFHHESASLGQPDTPERKELFSKEVGNLSKRWGELLEHDPAYNPNLTVDGEGFGISDKPRRRKKQQLL